VHIDGTARPQIVCKETNELLYDILTVYKKLNGNLALVNTSFNIHEEPIVNTIEDGLRSFFLSDLDFIYIENIGLIDINLNRDNQLNYLLEYIRINKSNRIIEFQKLSYESDKMRAKINQLQNISHHWYTEFNNVNDKMSHIFNSRSWRYTLILRKIKLYLNKLLNIIKAV
jgi:hypothetical protein